MQFCNDKPVTLVHGVNTLGKTTFTQILKSLGSDEPSLITKRRSIPPISGMSQKVVVHYKTLVGVEEVVTFNSGSWGSSELQGKIMVFDQEFVHSHVMTGDLITRENKETFTDFVLGSAGVNLSQKIERDKKTLRTEKSNLPNFRPDFVKGTSKDTEVDEFVNMKIVEDMAALEMRRESEEKRLRRLEKNGDFQALSIPPAADASAEEDFEVLIKEFSFILAENYDQVSDEAWEILQNQIHSHCGGDSAVSWLKTGLKVRQSESCPFCGQDLGNAKVLIDTYRTLFDQKFEEYDAKLKTRVQKLLSDVGIAIARSYVAPINDFIKQSQEFSPFIPDLETELTKMDEDTKLLEALDEEFKLTLAEWNRKISIELEDKLRSTHKSMYSSIDHSTLLEQSRQVASKQSDIRTLQAQIITHISNAKKKVAALDPGEIEKEKLTLTTQIDKVNREIARVAQDNASLTYIAKREGVIKLKKEIDEDIDQLETEQSDYLESYFERLDHWFKQLGSNSGFTIMKSTNDKGDKKVYTLALKFHGQKILPEDLSTVFSESDKRNLALSIFLSKADNISSKNKHILLFDDPVVSFDDNRRKNTCRIIKSLSSDFRQIIVTTHYSSLVKHFVEQQVPSQYIEIVSENNQSCLKVLDPTAFVLAPHQRQCEELIEFVEGGQLTAQRDFRPFMEEHLHQRYQSQIKTTGIGTKGLRDLIDALFDSNLIGAKSKQDLHNFRDSFNPEHHREGEIENIEELRLEAKQLLELLYGDLRS